MPVLPHVHATAKPTGIDARLDKHIIYNGMRGFQLPFEESPDAGSTPAGCPTAAITGRVSIERIHAQKSMLGQLSAEKGRKGRLDRPPAFFNCLSGWRCLPFPRILPAVVHLDESVLKHEDVVVVGVQPLVYACKLREAQADDGGIGEMLFGLDAKPMLGRLAFAD